MTAQLSPDKKELAAIDDGTNSPKTDRSLSEFRIMAGMAIVGLGTFLAVFIAPNSFGAYPIWSLAVGILLLCGYATYLVLYDGTRARGFLLHYFSALAALVLIPVPDVLLGPEIIKIIESYVGSSYSRILSVGPLLGAFYAILRTYLQGSAPDMVISHKRFDE